MALPYTRYLTPSVLGIGSTSGERLRVSTKPGQSQSPGGACTHWKSAALSRRTWKAEIWGSAKRHASHIRGLSVARGCAVKRAWLVRAVTILLLVPSLSLQSASAQQRGGILKVYHWVSPASMSIHEEGGYSASVSGMGVFNNLVLYKQDVPQNSLASIVPELASEWSWNDDGTVLTFRLRSDVKWHDGKPFTADDVKCTCDMLLGKISPGFRLNRRKAWYHNLREITTNGDNEVAFHLNRPQPAFIALLAAGVSPVYPCHVTPAEMRRQPVGTGPFKFAEFKPNESIKLVRNPDYWKKGRPTSMGSNIRSSRTARRRYWHSSPGSST